MNCVFCTIVRKEIPSQFVDETDDFIVINDLHPAAPVHHLVIPKIHYSEFMDMPDELLATLLTYVKVHIKKEHIVSYRLVNNGKGAAAIDHFHLHILGKVDKNRQL